MRTSSIIIVTTVAILATGCGTPELADDVSQGADDMASTISKIADIVPAVVKAIDMNEDAAKRTNDIAGTAAAAATQIRNARDIHRVVSDAVRSIDGIEECDDLMTALGDIDSRLEESADSVSDLSVEAGLITGDLIANLTNGAEEIERLDEAIQSGREQSQELKDKAETLANEVRQGAQMMRLAGTLLSNGARSVPPIRIDFRPFGAELEKERTYQRESEADKVESRADAAMMAIPVPDTLPEPTGDGTIGTKEVVAGTVGIAGMFGLGFGEYRRRKARANQMPVSPPFGPPPPPSPNGIPANVLGDLSYSIASDLQRMGISNRDSGRSRRTNNPSEVDMAIPAGA